MPKSPSKTHNKHTQDPINDNVNQSMDVLKMQKIRDNLDQLLRIDADRADSLQYRNEAEQFSIDLEAAKNAAETAQLASENARDLTNTYKDAAAVSEANSLSSETASAVSESNALNSANNAASSEANASLSESNASTSASNAAISESNSSTSASIATAKADIATTKANEALTSATTATTKASEANTSAVNAANSASTATTKANDATTQAGIATTKANEANQSAIDAAASAASINYQWSQIENKPTTISGYAISDAYTKTEVDTALAGKSGTSHTHTFASLTSKPTTLDGYGITDAYTQAQINSSLAGKSDTSHNHDSSYLAGAYGVSTSTYLRNDGTWATPPNTTYSAMSVAEMDAGTATSSRTIRADYLKTHLDGRLAGKADSGHNHDGTYALSSHTHDYSSTFLGISAKAADASLLNGVAAAEASTASTIVKRNSSGDINARLFRSEYDSTNATIGYIMTQVDTVSNNYMRPSTPAQVAAALAPHIDTTPGTGTVPQTALIGPVAGQTHQIDTIFNYSEAGNIGLASWRTHALSVVYTGVSGTVKTRIGFQGTGTTGSYIIALEVLVNGVVKASRNVTQAGGSLVYAWSSDITLNAGDVLTFRYLSGFTNSAWRTYYYVQMYASSNNLFGAFRNVV